MLALLANCALRRLCTEARQLYDRTWQHKLTLRVLCSSSARLFVSAEPFLLLLSLRSVLAFFSKSLVALPDFGCVGGNGKLASADSSTSGLAFAAFFGAADFLTLSL